MQVPLKYRQPAILAAVVAIAFPTSAGAHGDPPSGLSLPVLLAQARPDSDKELAAYRKARLKFDQEAASYWKEIDEKRRARFEKRRTGQPIGPDDYVLSQPPVYSGPPIPPVPTPPRPPIPVVPDFLRSAAEKFAFVPDFPKDEIEFKRAYAKVAAAAGLTKDQAVRIYGFEASGNGKYDVQAGLETPKPGARAISTALGYNQLLAANSVELLAEQGDAFVRTLEDKAVRLGSAEQKRLRDKIAILKRMIAFAKSVPDSWGEHVRLGKTPEGLGIHALNLDSDIGPLLQTQKLMNSVIFARAKGYSAPLTAAELEMMNLTGDGNGMDMVLMPASLRSRVPTSNFFQPGGYERNPVAQRNNVVEKLIAATNTVMDREIGLPGAKDLAAQF